MQTIGMSSAAIAARVFRLTHSSVSPNSRRRSEWPTMTWLAPASLIIAALTSPVNAPSRSKYRSCAAMPMRVLRAASAGETSDGERRRDDDLDVADALDQRAELAHERERLLDGLVHLPVGGEQRSSHGQLSDDLEDERR